MKKPIINVLKILRKATSYIKKNKVISKPECDKNAESVSHTIYAALSSSSPCMIARFGANELNCIGNYLGIKNKRSNRVLSYILGGAFPWWWDEGVKRQMFTNAGFFPLDNCKLEKFSELMIADINELDILGSWLANEHLLEGELSSKVKIQRILMEPFWVDEPWTKILKGKKILVVHPFSKTIELQYKKRNLIFENSLLPEFELITLKAVQTITGLESNFGDWFEALNYMKTKMDKIDYDICLIGAGAYGFPLAAHAKRQGKKSIHLGGSLQLLFGIKGQRWEDPNYNSVYNYTNLFNKYWVKPLNEETPPKSKDIEGSCYW